MRLQRQPLPEGGGGGKAGDVAARGTAHGPIRRPLLGRHHTDLGLLAFAPHIQDPHPVQGHVQPGGGRVGGQRQAGAPGGRHGVLHLGFAPGADGLRHGADRAR